MPIRVFLLDDHEVVRRGLRDLLESEDDLVVVGEAGTAEEARARVPATRPDVAVLDVRLPDGDGIEVCRDLLSQDPKLRCLMLTSFADDEALASAIVAGASGYVLKQVRGTDLIDGIRRVAAGESLLDPATTARVLERLQRKQGEPDEIAVLSAQERKIFALIGEGLTNRQIAEQLFLAEKTVKNYVSNLLNKLGMSRRTQAAAYAARLDERREHPAIAAAGMEDLPLLDVWWRAANYLAVGQIYLLDNPLLREPLASAHIKPRLLGHWGTSPGLNFVYAHLNRVIRARDEELLFVTGPGHGGPALVGAAWLEGTYSEVYPHISRDEEGMRRLFRQFSFPGGIPSHVAPETPGSIHEGGELGYSLAHAYGAAFDNPALTVACVIGDGEAETGPLAASWHSNKFLNPARDGRVLPILHLNGYKIANPTILARIPGDELRKLLEGYGHRPFFVEGSDPTEMHEAMAACLDEVFDDLATIRSEARSGDLHRPLWPCIVLRSPKGWTGPKSFDGLPLEGSFRSHQVPLTNPRGDERQLRALEEWMLSYRPAELSMRPGRRSHRWTASSPPAIGA